MSKEAEKISKLFENENKQFRKLMDKLHEDVEENGEEIIKVKDKCLEEMKNIDQDGVIKGLPLPDKCMKSIVVEFRETNPKEFQQLLQECCVEEKEHIKKYASLSFEVKPGTGVIMMNSLTPIVASFAYERMFEKCKVKNKAELEKFKKKNPQEFEDFMKQCMVEELTYRNENGKPFKKAGDGEAGFCFASQIPLQVSEEKLIAKIKKYQSKHSK